jgi:isoleucyl-tRNA synthetase
MIDLKSNEEKVLGYWEKNSISQTVRRKNGFGKAFYFLEGPPYASGILASHHIWVYTIKDIILRYRRYLGYNVHDRAGFDVHGLPIENKVERSLQVSSKKDIEERIGIASFVESCKSYAATNVESAVKVAKRFAISLNFDDLYLAYNNSYMDTEWSIFKKMYEKRLIYKGRSSIAYCPHCETVLSAQGPEVEHANDTDPSIFVRFPANGMKQSRMDVEANTYLVIWTTTPWTLPSNVAIAVNPKAIYVKALFGNATYIIAKDKLDTLVKAVGESAIVKAEFTGSELEGLQYKSPLELEVPHQKKLGRYHRIVADEGLVSISEGTGLVHIAPGHGPEDYKLGKRLKMPAFCPVGLDARYTHEAGKYAGLKVPSEANKAVLSDLRANGDVLFEGSITHSYPHCWRCESKLIFIVTDQWFMNSQKIKTRMLRENAKIRWHPAKAVDWQRDAIESAPDWCISRQRYWGVPIPIWACKKCNSVEAIGSADELRQRGGLQETPKNLHRPYVDEIKIGCKGCQGEMFRIKDILDVWYDAAIAHTASLTRAEFKELFPADWITESRDQIRGWFMGLLRTSVAIYGKTPFKEVNIGGMIFDELGNEMHRHLGNAYSAKDLPEIVSADGYRLWCSSHPRWQDLKLKKEELTEADRNILTLYNVAELAREFAMLSKADTKNPKLPSQAALRQEDRWILSKFNSLVSGVTAHLGSYEIDDAVNEIKNFLLEDFSRFYLKLAKQRAANAGKKEQKAISNIVSYLLKNLIIMGSVVMPFACESIYLDLFSLQGESVFMNGWPKPKKKLLDEALEKDFKVMEEVSNAILALRERHNVKLRQPLAAATIETTEDFAMLSVQKLSILISSYTNIHNIKVSKTTRSSKTVKPIFNRLGPDFKENAKTVADALAAADAEAMAKAIETAGSYQLKTERGIFQINPGHFTVVEKPVSGDAMQFKYGNVSIDTTITEELKEELLIREITRSIQMQRKKMGLTRVDRISTKIAADEHILKNIASSKDQISDITRSSRIELVDKIDSEVTDGSSVTEVEVFGKTLKIKITHKKGKEAKS